MSSGESKLSAARAYLKLSDREKDKNAQLEYYKVYSMTNNIGIEIKRFFKFKHNLNKTGFSVFSFVGKLEDGRQPFGILIFDKLDLDDQECDNLLTVESTVACYGLFLESSSVQLLSEPCCLRAGVKNGYVKFKNLYNFCSWAENSFCREVKLFDMKVTTIINQRVYDDDRLPLFSLCLDEVRKKENTVYLVSLMSEYYKEHKIQFYLNFVTFPEAIKGDCL